MAKEFQTIIKIGANTTEFNKSNTQIQRELRVMDSAFKDVSTQAKSYGETTVTLKQKQNLLTEKIKLQSSSVAKLKEKYDASVKSVGENKKATQNLSIQYNNAVNKLTQMEGNLNNVTNKLKAQAPEVKKLGTKLGELADKTKASADDMNTLANGCAKASAVILGMSTVTGKMAMDFEDQMAKVHTISNDSERSIDQLGDGVKALAEKFGIASEDLAEAEYQTISSNVKTADSLGFLNEASKTAIAGHTDVTTAVDILTTVLNSYQLEVQETTRISDELVTMQRLGKVTIGELGDSIGALIPLASQMNLKTSSLFASIASLTSNGLKADQAMTAMKTTMTAVIKPTAEATKLAKKLGIQFTAVHLENVGLPKFLDEIKRKTHGNSEAMGTLFGNVKSLTATLSLNGKANKSYKRILDEMKNSAGETSKAFEIMNDTTGAEARKAWEATKNVGKELGDSLLPVLEKILYVVVPIAKVIGAIPGPVVQIAAAIGLVLAGGVALMKTYTLVNKGMKAVSKVTELMGTKFGGTYAKIMLAVIALTALAAIIMVIMGKSKPFERSVETLNKIKIPSVPDQGKQTRQHKQQYNSYAVGTNRLKANERLDAHVDEAIIPAKNNPFNPNATDLDWIKGTGNSSNGDTIIVEHMDIHAKDMKEFQDVFNLFKGIKQTSRQLNPVK